MGRRKAPAPDPDVPPAEDDSRDVSVETSAEAIAIGAGMAGMLVSGGPFAAGAIAGELAAQLKQPIGAADDTPPLASPDDP